MKEQKNGNYITGGDSKVVRQYYKSKSDLLNDLSGRYESRLEYSLSYKQVKLAIEAAYKDAQDYYHVYFHNCGEVVYNGMKAAGFKNIDISVSPNKMFYQFRDN